MSRIGWSARQRYAGKLLTAVDLVLSLLAVRSAPAGAKVTRCLGIPADIVGTNGQGVLHGTPRHDVIIGLGGDDTINGMGGNETICGEDDNDSLSGGDGND